MAGQGAMLTRKESLAKQKAACLKEATPGEGSGGAGNPECHPATPGVKKVPSSAKG